MTAELPARILDAATPALTLERWRDVPRWCGSSHPGVGKDNAGVMDFAARQTTLDQQRIEEALDRLLDRGDRILHVGIGNSSLARRFAARVARIVGLTLSEHEHRHGTGLDIANYQVLLMNKYTPAVAAVPGPFDYIVDNNPSSFACCVGHFQVMLGAYTALLRPGGLLVTDRVGLGWCYANGPMSLDFDDLEALCNLYPFEAGRLTRDVFTLRRKTG